MQCDSPYLSLKQLWTDAIQSPDFHISRTERYGSAELDIIASRHFEPGEVVDSLRGYNLKLCGPEETLPDGFNELLTFENDSTGNVSIGLGPLRILNVSTLHPAVVSSHRISGAG